MERFKSKIYKIISPSTHNLDDYSKPLFYNQNYAEERLEYLRNLTSFYLFKDELLIVFSIRFLLNYAVR